MYNTSPMTSALNKYITIDEKILGGTPVLSGTRIPIDRIKFLVKTGYTTEDLHKEYPYVNAKKIQILMSYLMDAGLDAYTKYRQGK